MSERVRWVQKTYGDAVFVHGLGAPRATLVSPDGVHAWSIHDAVLARWRPWANEPALVVAAPGELVAVGLSVHEGESILVAALETTLLGIDGDHLDVRWRVADIGEVKSVRAVGEGGCVAVTRRAVDPRGWETLLVDAHSGAIQTRFEGLGWVSTNRAITFVAGVTDDGSVVVLDRKREVAVRHPMTPPARRVALSEDGAWWVAALGPVDHPIADTIIVAQDTGATGARWVHRSFRAVDDLAVSRDGRRVVVDDEGLLHLGAVHGSPTRLLVSHNGAPMQCQHTPRHPEPARVGFCLREDVGWWFRYRGTPPALGSVTHAAMSPRGQWVAVCDRQQGIVVLDAERSEIEREITMTSGEVKALAWGVDGKTLLGVIDHALVAWDVEEGSERWRLPLSIRVEPTIDNAVIVRSPDGTAVVVLTTMKSQGREIVSEVVCIEPALAAVRWRRRGGRYAPHGGIALDRRALWLLVEATREVDWLSLDTGSVVASSERFDRSVVGDFHTVARGEERRWWLVNPSGLVELDDQLRERQRADFGALWAAGVSLDGTTLVAGEMTVVERGERDGLRTLHPSRFDGTNTVPNPRVRQVSVSDDGRRYAVVRSDDTMTLGERLEPATATLPLGAKE